MAIVNPIVSTAEIQTVTVDATGGDFTVTYLGVTSGTIAFNASGATFSAAMDTITDSAGDCVVTGGPGASGGGTPYTLTWAAERGNVATPTTNAAGLTGGAGTAVVAVVTPGVSALANPTLSVGAHSSPTDPNPGHGDWQWCMMEVAAWMADEAWTSEPANVSPVIVAVCNSFNDMLDNNDRQGLKTYLTAAPDGVIDTVDGTKETAREWMCSDWLVRTLLPMYLDYSTDADVLTASTAIKALPALAAGTFDEAATLAALETAGRAVWAWRATLEPEAFELTGGGSPTFAAASLVTLFDSLGGDYVDHYFGLIRGVGGVTSTGYDNGGHAMTTAIRAMRQAVWDICITWVPNEFFTGRSADYAFRRGGDYVPGSAFMLIRDCVQALVAGQALSDGALLAYNEPEESGFYAYYQAAYAAAISKLSSLSAGSDTATAMLDLIDDLSAA